MSGAPAFTFITTDARSRSAREAVKVHVLRQRHHIRRQSQQTRKSATTTSHRGGQLHLWDSNSSLVQGPQSSKTTLTNNSSSRARRRDDAYPEDLAHYTPAIHSKSNPNDHVTWVNSTYDYVAYVPRSPRCGPEDLVIHYYMLEGCGCGVTQSWLQSFRTNAASFTAFLAIASSLYLRGRGVQSGIDSREKEAQALQEINKQIELSPSAHNAGTMLAVALLGNLQELREEHAVAQWHWNGLKRMIDINGGMRSLRNHSELHTFLFWLDALVCHASISALGQEYMDIPITPEDPSHYMKELLLFLDRIRSQAGQHHTSRTQLEAAPLISQILRRRGPSAGCYTVMKTIRAQIACLVYFALLRLPFSGPLRDILTYQNILKQVQHHGKSHSVSPLELFYIILAVSNHDGVCHIIYVVSRLMNAIKQLDHTDCSAATQLLSDFTGHPDPFQQSNELSDEAQGLSSSLEVPAQHQHNNENQC